MLFAIISQAQNKYPSLWEKVAIFEKDALPKSALKVVNEIYEKATKENNSPQIIKSLLYKSKFSLTLEEDAQLTIVNQFKEQIKKSSFPTSNVLENLLATMYWQYFNQNRWKFYNRTQTTQKIDVEDFRTWDLQTLFKEVHTYYQNSLKKASKLQEIDIRRFEDILVVAKESQKYRPTLYDLLAQNALTFYSTNETQITKPAYQFKIDNPDFICEANAFVKLKIQTKDTLSLQFNALKIYQELIKFHQKKRQIAALVDVDLQRLAFVKENATFPQKEKTYLETLKNSESVYNNNPASGLYAFEIAKIYNARANTYAENKKVVYRFKNKEALSICKRIQQQFPNSLAAKKCAALVAQIQLKNIQITTEKNIPVDAYSKVLINYKNIDQLYFTVYKTDEETVQEIEKLYNKNAKAKKIASLQKLTTWESKLPNEEDYLNHTTEIIIPKLLQGQYLIVASTKRVITASEIYGVAPIQVTNLALINRNESGTTIYQVVNRNTGKPIAKATVHLNNAGNRYDKKIDKIFTTNKNGEFTISSDTYLSNVKATIRYKNETATFGKYYLRKNYTNNEVQKKQTRTFLFTDRSIYRPGQLIYFKGIALESLKNQSEVVTGETVTVILKDVNYQPVAEQTFKTNDFGSFAGNFTIPNTGLTGNFTLEATLNGRRNYQSISVEEYKRPKFKTNFKPVTQTYQLNELLKITGFATAFAGTNITDAKVVYRVNRQVQYPRWCYWYYPFLNSDPQEIVNGETITNEKGEFEIDFKAIPDETVARDKQPIFNYEITADVTDINGETRSATTIVKVGYQTLIASIEMQERINKNDTEQKVRITTNNLNNQPVATSGKLVIYKLEAPKRVLRKRPWSAPDYQTIPKNEFVKKFPHDAYKNENDYLNWEKGTVVFSSDFTTKNGLDEVPLNTIKKWISGKYIVEVTTKDNHNQTVTDKAYFSVFSPKEKLPSDNQLISITTNKETYTPNETAIVTVASNSKDITVMLYVEKKNKIINSYYIHLDKDSETIKIPVTKDDFGGFGIRYYYVNYNEFDTGSMLISVPYPKTDLEITTKTFRDKLQPGANETWSFTVKGPQKEKVTAEVLASMYDASLDEFKEHNWSFTPITKPTYYIRSFTNAENSFGTRNFNIIDNYNSYVSPPNIQYDQFNWFGFYFGNSNYLSGPEAVLQKSIMVRGVAAPNARKRAASKIQGKVSGVLIENESVDQFGFNDDTNLDEVVTTGVSKPKNENSLENVQIRKNLQETAFFYPHLTTNANGDVTFNFTIPEALTKWKLQLLAHDKQLQSAIETLETVTQKELMIVPNAPRFLREGDQITLSAKISNLTDKKLTGVSQLVLTDAITGKPIDVALHNNKNQQSFSVDAKGNTQVSWNLNIPATVQAVQYQVIAKAGDFSDGEQNVLPVLSNRMLVTETLPMWVRSNQTKTFTLDKLLKNKSKTLKNHTLTLEVTSNPTWYAIQALPYLMEYPYECAEQTFSRYYANAIGSHIANSNPRIQEVFNQWKTSKALLSNLEKNQELKSLIIQETPWLRDAQSETEQKKRIALLFDLNTMNNELQRSFTKLQDMQMDNGGFPWFKGAYRPSNNITNYIATGFGHLQKLGIQKLDTKMQQMLRKAVVFLDGEIADSYQKLLDEADKLKQQKGAKTTNDFLAKQHVSYFQLEYLYMRSFYDNIPISAKTKKAINYYQEQSATYWTKFNLLGKGYIALTQFRNGNSTVANKILNSLQESSINSEELGMYWKANKAGWYWHQAPIETQALLIEAFAEIKNDTKIVDDLKIWLLKNKQVNQWKTTKATSEAVYALLLQGSEWLASNELVTVTIGGETLDPLQIAEAKLEAGTGYFKTSWKGKEINPEKAKVTLAKKDKGIAWGGLYWQYFEDLDKITSAKTPLQLSKKLFKKVNSDTGKQLIPVTNTTLEVGDLVTVRIELRADRTMEFIHMKDMRAAAFEPVDVLSSYKWQDGLGYYQSTKDAATNFFFSRLPKGIYVFEYDVRVNNKGDFSNGITTIQSMYAPEFSSHSKGIRVEVK